MLVNGSRATSLPLDNRGLAYGDGLFETIRIQHHKLLFINEHLDRMSRGLDILGIKNCISDIREDIASIENELPGGGVLKIIVTRGAGGRGYRPDENNGADRILTLHSLAPQVENLSAGIMAFVCKTRLHHDIFAGIKHLNRLEQVMASREWPGQEFHEGLMLDSKQQVVEGTRSNVFIFSADKLMTADLECSGIAGILRGKLLREFPETVITTITREQLEQADELFFCNSVAGVWPVSKLLTEDGRILNFTPGKWCARATEYFQTALDELA